MESKARQRQAVFLPASYALPSISCPPNTVDERRGSDAARGPCSASSAPSTCSTASPLLQGQKIPAILVLVPSIAEHSHVGITMGLPSAARCLQPPLVGVSHVLPDHLAGDYVEAGSPLR